MLAQISCIGMRAALYCGCSVTMAAGMARLLIHAMLRFRSVRPVWQTYMRSSDEMNEGRHHPPFPGESDPGRDWH